MKAWASKPRRVFKSILFLLFFSVASPVLAECAGKLTNPISDICWSCMFPLSMGSFTVYGGLDSADPSNPSSPICFCGSPIPRVGLSIGFWEPIRLVETTHDPFCFISLGGITLDPGVNVGQGTQESNDAQSTQSFYQAHWYAYPAIYWLELLTNILCLEGGSFDLAYMTELDPLWQNDELAFILNAEAALFGNPIAQAACGADCLAATNSLPIDSLFWCAGCQGSMYPLTGYVAAHLGGVQASTLIAERLTFKMHRQGMLAGTMGERALCGNYFMPIMAKSQYKLQMTYPVPSHAGMGKFAANPYGRSTTPWEAGREFPIEGEGYAYAVWRKRNCCAL